MVTTKSFLISKHLVWDAYKKVKGNKGIAGVDEQSIEDFEKDLKDNLYKIWNRMSSGSYFPPPVLTVEILKSDGGKRKLGISTVTDRIAQTVVKMVIEEKIDPIFHPDSYGYRPNKSAIDAVSMARQRCWKYDWVLDMDIKGFFDNIDHELLMRAVRKHTDCKWVLMYIERWLKAPIQQTGGTLEKRDKGTVQGSVVSPILANLFLHYAFDTWMQRNFPNIPFERYADDAVVHCKSEEEAEQIAKAIEERLEECKLTLNLSKTKIVYCKDDKRRKDYPNISFDFLGYRFRPRKAMTRWGKYFINFTPAISKNASKSIRDKIGSLRLHRRTDLMIEDIAKRTNPMIRGWLNYFGKFYKSALYHTFQQLNRILIKWAIRKYKKLKGSQIKATRWLRIVLKSKPQLFAHWKFGITSMTGQ